MRFTKETPIVVVVVWVRVYSSPTGLCRTKVIRKQIRGILAKVSKLGRGHGLVVGWGGGERRAEGARTRRETARCRALAPRLIRYWAIF